MTCSRPNVARSNPKDWGELAEPLRSRAWTLAQDFGLVLVSGYRDSGRQWDLRHERCPGRECSTSCKGYPVTARPGASKHEARRAADLGGSRLAEAMRHREAYGLALTVPSEGWHVEADARDSRTRRTHNRPTARIRTYGKPALQPSIHSVFQRGDSGPGVAFLRAMLTILARQRIPKSGKGVGAALPPGDSFDAMTAEAVREFQRFVNAMYGLAGSKERVEVDGVVGPVTMKLIEAWVPVALGKR